MNETLLELLKRQFMSGGATDLRNMGMAAGLGRMSMGGQAYDPVRAMASKVGGQGLNQLLEAIKRSQDVQAKSPGGGPLSRAGMPMQMGVGAAMGAPQPRQMINPMIPQGMGAGPVGDIPTPTIGGSMQGLVSAAPQAAQMAQPYLQQLMQQIQQQEAMRRIMQ